MKKQNRAPSLKVIVVQTTSKNEKLSFNDIDVDGLRLFMIHLVALGIDLVDFILMGPDEYLSMKENKTAWQKYKQSIDSMQKLLFEDMFDKTLFGNA